MQKAKKYYNQRHIISEIHQRTGCTFDDINKVLNSLGDVVKDKSSDRDNYVEIKLFPGLKITAKFIPPEQSKSNLDIHKSDSVLSLNAAFSDYFRKEIRKSHSNIK